MRTNRQEPINNEGEKADFIFDSVVYRGEEGGLIVDDRFFARSFTFVTAFSS